MTRKQKKREQIANICDSIAQGKSFYGQQLRATNRRVDQKKKIQYRLSTAKEAGNA